MSNFLLNFQKKLFQNKRRGKKKSLSLFENDVFLISYPKSGSTWIRFMLGNYFSGNKCDFTNYHLLVPDLHRNIDCLKTTKQKPRYLKSHQYFSPQFENVVYIVRDGRDVAVSYYYHSKKSSDLWDTHSCLLHRHPDSRKV